MKITPKTLKGFRDFLPKEARKRQYVIDTLRKGFESYGFEPLETPVLEYEEILAGKYGEEGDKLMYRFEDNGQRRVAMRYDQTVPLARVVAQYVNGLPLPFKRYQISNVWRGENTQKGRFREFTQCDIDCIGTTSILADAEVIEVACSSLKKLGFEKFKVLINDRKVFAGLIEDSAKLPLIVRAVDKIKKIGRDKVLEELTSIGLENNAAEKILKTLEEQKPTEGLNTLFKYLKELGVPEENFEFAPFLARGLDYYTGTIFEIEIEGYDAGSVCGGGRYDNLIGMFGSQDIPAVGCAFGFDRVLEAMEALQLFPKDLGGTKILVTIFPEMLKEALDAITAISKYGINAEIYLDPAARMDKQLKYADQKGIPYVAIIGPNEAKAGLITLKNLSTREQKTIKLTDIPQEIK